MRTLRKAYIANFFARCQKRSDSRGRLRTNTSGEAIITWELEADNEIRPTLLADGGDDLSNESTSILPTTTIGIIADVGLRR